MEKEKIITRNLKCYLTDEDILEYADRMARELDDLAETEAQLSEVKQDFKHRLERHNAQINFFSRKVRNKYEMAEIDCKWQFNWGDNSKSLIRLDTKEVVDNRPIEEADRQQQFKHAPKGRPKEEAPE